jgi:multidrug efflux system membrane fusion protein
VSTFSPSPAVTARSARGAVLVAAASLLSAAALVACQPAVAPAAASAAPPAPAVTAATVIERRIEQTTTHVGRVEPAQRVELRPRVSGHVEAVLFREGELVQAGQPLFRIDPRPFDAALARARADVALARSREALARSEAERARRLAAEHALSTEEHERRSAALAEAQARTAAAEAALQSAALDREFAVVRAPIGGRIGRALVTAGNTVAAGPSQAPLATQVATAPLHVHVDVSDPATLQQLGTRRSTAGWRLHVLDPGTGQPLAVAPVDFSDNEVAPGAGTLRLRARIDQPGPQLLPGQFVRTLLATGAAAPVLLVQDKAIGTDQGRRYVLVVDEQQALQYRPVTLGPLQGELRVVSAGLKAGERIVVSGLMRARPGMTVQPQMTPMDAAPAAQAAAASAPARS